MKLKSVWISGFRSFKERDRVKDKMPFIVDEKITILIGANDHGKTNILDAILRLNDDSPIKEEDKNWDISDGSKPLIEWQFIFDDEDELKQLKENTPPTPVTSISTSPSVLTVPQIPQEGSIVGIVKTETYPVSKDKNTITYIREGIDSPVHILSTPFEIETKYEKQLLDMRPRIELFKIPQEDNVVDSIEKKQLSDSSDKKHELIKGLFITAGIWEMRERLFGDSERSSKSLEMASTKLTEVMQQKWGQKDGLIWKFKQAGTSVDTIKLRLEDPSVNSMDVPPSRRSSGFRTFFLLSMVITARIYDSKDKPRIYLFDEPGTYLHPRAQIDLQRSFEKRAEEAQIIYTTHSLFLVSKNYPKRNRVISKTIDGTKIDQKPFISNWKSVRDSLGIVMSNNFLIADKSILFEGPSDQFYLYNAIRKLKEDSLDIDLNDFSTVDGGNSQNYVAMAKVLIEEGRSILCVVDGDDGGQNILDDIEKVKKDEKQKKEAYSKLHSGEEIASNPEVYDMKLPDNCSVEDIFADRSLLLKAIKNVALNLTTLKLRSFIKESFSINEAIKNIDKKEKKTLGKLIDEETEKWFKDGKKISKLSIALEYDRLTHEEDYKVSSHAKDIIKKIQKTLKLKGEKSAESGVFGEV